MTVLIKDPQSVLDYRHDWETFYLDNNEKIDTRQWFVKPSGELMIEGADDQDVVFIAGGIAGHLYQLTEQVLTNAGRTIERSISIRVQNR